jgi:hypothetical protein
LTAIPLAQVVKHAFYLSMGNLHETESRWTRVGEVVLWIVFYFWAVWIFNAFLPPKPEQTPFETYLKNTISEQNYGGASSERDLPPDGSSINQPHHSFLNRPQQ